MGVRTMAAVLSCMFACGRGKSARIEDAREQVSGRDCAGVALDTETFRFVENGPGDISSRVFAAADFMRGDAELTALGVVMDPATRETQRFPLEAGTLVEIGADRYCVTKISATSTQGFVLLRRVVGPM